MSKYHVHCDLGQVPPVLEAFLRGLQFYPDHFVSCDWPVSYAPENHWTRKFEESEGAQFRHCVAEVKKWAEKNPDQFSGYMEAEVLTTDVEIPDCVFDSSVQFPFKLSSVPIGLGFFRQSEIHISLSEDETERAVRQALHDAGFFPARYKESWGPEEIWTIQGSQFAIRAILPATLDYLHKVGGVAKCSVQEEVVAACHVHPFDSPLPPVISKIEWL